MYLKKLTAISAAFLTSAIMLAVPARPGFHTVTGPDGRPVEVEMVGDENFHYFMTREGEKLMRDESGKFERVDDSMFEVRRTRALAARKNPVELQRTFPTTVTVRGLVVLAEFPDCKFREGSTSEYFEKKINSLGYTGPETFGSVADFYAEQSGGRFTPVFDIVGPVTMPHPASYYVNGRNDLSEFFRDIATLADKECDVDFTRYDVNDDGYVDFMFSIFAGYSQAQSLNPEDIWPAMMYLNNYVYDLFDDMYLNVAACSSELKGSEGEDLDGIGTICHEFSHILGLPDIYDTRYSSGYGMAHYDIMDVGTYNGNGRTPAGYTAMDRYTLGWLDPVVLEGSGRDYELENLIDSNKALFIVNPENDAEFFTLENRQRTGFDSELPGHGLIVTQVHYDPKVWKNNLVNTVSVSGYEHVRLIAADNNWINTSEAADPFPGVKGVTSFGADTRPAAKWHTSQNVFDCPLTNIRETEDGRILFDYGQEAGVAAIGEEDSTVAGMMARGAQVYDLNGRLMNPDALLPGMYIIRGEGKSVKTLIR